MGAHLPHLGQLKGEDHEHLDAHHPPRSACRVRGRDHYVRRQGRGSDTTWAFTIEGWKAAWANPSPERMMARIPSITTPDVAGYWPRTTRPVRGLKEYAQRIVELLTFIPDFRAELVENATNDDVMFLRWVARGTGA